MSKTPIKIETAKDFVEHFHLCVDGANKHQLLVERFDKLVTLEENVAKSATDHESKKKTLNEITKQMIDLIKEAISLYDKSYYCFTGIFICIMLIERPYIIRHVSDAMKSALYKSIKLEEIKTELGLLVVWIRSVYLIAGHRLMAKEEVMKTNVECIKKFFEALKPTPEETEQFKIKIEQWCKRQETLIVDFVKIAAQQYVKILIGFCFEYLDYKSVADTDENVNDQTLNETNGETSQEIKSIFPTEIKKPLDHHDEFTPEELKDIRNDIFEQAKLGFQFLEEWYFSYRKSRELIVPHHYETLGFYLEMLFYGFGCEKNFKKWAEIVRECYEGPLKNDFGMLRTYMHSLNLSGLQSLAANALEDFVNQERKYESELEEKMFKSKVNHAVHLYLQTASKQKIKEFLPKHKNDSDYTLFQYAMHLSEEQKHQESCQILIDMVTKIFAPKYKDTLMPITKAKVVAELCSDLINGIGCDKNTTLAKELCAKALDKLEDADGDLNIVMATLNHENPEIFRKHCLEAHSKNNIEALALAEYYNYDDLVQEMDYQQDTPE